MILMVDLSGNPLDEWLMEDWEWEEIDKNAPADESLLLDGEK